VTEDAPTGVGTTAVGVAAMRAAETRRPDRLFEDPLAAAFVAGAGWGRIEIEHVEPERRPGIIALAAWVSARTRFLDDLVVDAIASGVRQVVLLGAGLDARAFRLPWPGGVRVFELDTPAMLAFKQRVVDEVDAKPRSERLSSPSTCARTGRPRCAKPASTPVRPQRGWSRACSSTSTSTAWTG
jgi:methyltransferase (TIGR00027 family)